jgi:hypothetical protein
MQSSVQYVVPCLFFRVQFALAGSTTMMGMKPLANFGGVSALRRWYWWTAVLWLFLFLQIINVAVLEQAPSWIESVGEFPVAVTVGGDSILIVVLVEHAVQDDTRHSQDGNDHIEFLQEFPSCTLAFIPFHDDHDSFGFLLMVVLGKRPVCRDRLDLYEPRGGR